MDPLLGLQANYALLLSALENLLQNAFKFTQDQTEVKLTAYVAGGRVLIDVSDHCGGLPAGDANKLFIPFFQQSSDKTGVGLGLSMAGQAIDADGGELTVRDSPGWAAFSRSLCPVTHCSPAGSGLGGSDSAHQVGEKVNQYPHQIRVRARPSRWLKRRALRPTRPSLCLPLPPRPGPW